jgi:hypothetical protein
MKQNLVKFGLIAFMPVIGICILGCDNLNNPNTKTVEYTPLNERVSVGSLESSFSKAVWYMMDASEKAVEAAENYIDIPGEEAARKVNDSRILDMQLLGSYLPDDLTTLKRKSRGANTRNIEDLEETINLQDELNVIVEEYNEALMALVPSVEDVVLPEGVKIEDGFIYLSDDEIVPQNTLAGIAVVEVLTAVANGEDGEKTAQKISHEIEAMMTGDAGDAARGLYIKPIPLWRDGVVYYTWSDIRGSFKNAVEKAMTNWTNATGGEVQFKEYDFNAWNTFLLVIGVNQVVRISEKDLKSGASGEAAPGALPWGISYMHLDPEAVIDSDKEGRLSAYSVALHELGHILGLQHEHQRWDRDTYIDVDVTFNNFLNYTRLPELSIGVPRISLTWKSARVWFATIWYPVISFYIERIDQFAKTAWDFNSIMLYDMFNLKPAYANDTNGRLENGIYKTKRNVKLSSKDIEIIKRIY